MCKIYVGLLPRRIWSNPYLRYLVNNKLDIRIFILDSSSTTTLQKSLTNKWKKVNNLSLIIDNIIMNVYYIQGKENWFGLSIFFIFWKFWRKFSKPNKNTLLSPIRRNAQMYTSDKSTVMLLVKLIFIFVLWVTLTDVPCFLCKYVTKEWQVINCSKLVRRLRVIYTLTITIFHPDFYFRLDE